MAKKVQKQIKYETRVTAVFDRVNLEIGGGSFTMASGAARDLAQILETAAEHAEAYEPGPTVKPAAKRILSKEKKDWRP